ncbi:Calcium-regulated actin-bundling protein [Hondaea fermentalgiana]|uniref:Calcium-regulated actin-bundling protein n=1 Tax=Hondaea fermentalgiana TaxID=2315210 RepID=A0A2R5G425_9STRA|nr:Calcium-regulated actin-bundling protein [Hondaea fermentalgiana]|eukprot:GBG24528.1 Calcium-regulated actin-bundling protein [Hondaea fermentalgiana]
MADDDWDTSTYEEAPADPYNKSSFAGQANTSAGGSATEQPAKQQDQLEEISAPLEALSVEAEEPAAAPGEIQTPAAAAEALEAEKQESSMPPKAELSVENFEREAALSQSEAPPAPVSASSPSTAKSPSAASPGRRTMGAAPADAPEFLREAHHGTAFTEQLSEDGLKFFNDLCEKPFADQAVAFLNAYWAEVGPQAEFIFTVAYDVLRKADMHAKGVNYVHLYEEGNDLDFNIGLYFYEKLCKFVLDDDAGAKWRDDPQWAASMPTMMTAIKRKIELREKVDVNFDGRVSFLEYLLYQYREHANPADFVQRAMKHDGEEEHPEIVKAREALAEVNKAIQAYEAEKHRLTELSKQPGVKGLGGKHQLAILDASPLAEQLNKSLITAEAAVRIAVRKFGNGKVPVSSGSGEAAPSVKPTQGSMWWLQRDLEEKKKHYGRRAK